jgi:hypothetical protein
MLQLHYLISNLPPAPITACLSGVEDSGDLAFKGAEVCETVGVGDVENAVCVAPAGASAMSFISRFDRLSTMLLPRDWTRMVAGPLNVTNN